MPGPPTPLSAGDTLAFVLADLTIILVAARIVGTLFQLLNQPRVVGEIIAGILIGPTVLGGHLAAAATATKPAVDGTGLTNGLYPLQAFAFLNLFGQIALVFFMFLVGLELDRRLIHGHETQILAVALAVVLVPLAFGFVVGGLLTDDTWRPAGVSMTTFSLFMGAGISVTAFPVMARILQEKGMLASTMGAIGVGAAAVVTVLMFLCIAAATASANDAGLVTSIGLKVAYTAALVVGLVALVRPVLIVATRDFRPERPLDGNLLGGLLALALAVGLACDRIGVSALVGGFLAGLVVPARPGLAHAVVERMQTAVVIFLLPIFLAVSGLNTDLRVLSVSLVPGILLFIALMIVGKWGVGFVAGRLVGIPSNEAHLLGILLNCRGLLILVVALIGLQLKVITPAMQVVFVIGAIVTTLMTGPLVDAFLPRAHPEAKRPEPLTGVATIHA